MIDFSLTPEQKTLQKVAREFSWDVLAPIIKAADAEPDPQKGFQMIKPVYKQAYEMGFATGFLPKEYGGGGLTNVDVLIAVEEIGAVDPGYDVSAGRVGPVHPRRERDVYRPVATTDLLSQKSPSRAVYPEPGNVQRQRNEFLLGVLSCCGVRLYEQESAGSQC